jgi:8-oxo-dGTP pyrophosphatase MutT (NUDIX family)
MADLRSCGFLIIRGDPIREFLLMRHVDRWDLPKGHVDKGETDIECALRELVEETGITADDIDIVPGFRFETRYQVLGKRDGKLYDKTLVIFLGRVTRDVQVQVSEHPEYRWFKWQPPHKIQEWTIDPLLDELARFIAAE